LEHQKYSGGGAPPWTVRKWNEVFCDCKGFCGWIKDIVRYFVELYKLWALFGRTRGVVWCVCMKVSVNWKIWTVKVCAFCICMRLKGTCGCRIRLLWWRGMLWLVESEWGLLKFGIVFNI
jgi:hypothetical protein